MLKAMLYELTDPNSESKNHYLLDDSYGPTHQGLLTNFKHFCLHTTSVDYFKGNVLQSYTAGYDERNECSLQKKYTRKET